MRVMRGTALVAVLCLVVVSAAGARANGTPSLRFTDLIPVQAKGAKFAPGETVRVILRAGESKRVRVIRVSAGGTFTIGFGTLPWADRCSGDISLAASGTKGHRAVYTLQTTACPTGPPMIAPGPATRQGA